MTPRFALRQRPDAAFETLYRGHVHEVYRYTLAVLGNPTDAEDVTQTTFLNAYRAFNAGERPRTPTNWLRAIAHNVCRQRFRQAARRPHEVAELDETTTPATPEETDAPSAADITRALQSLPFNQRSALVMRELEGRRQTEIAEALGLSESAVEALLFRARRAMREQLETSLTCGEAARAISRQLDRSVSREERATLRAHIRSCPDCAAFARQARAQRGALKALGAAPLPASLLSWSGGSGAGAAAVAGGAPAAHGREIAAGIAAVAVLAGAGSVGLRGHSTPAGQRQSATQRDARSLAPAASPAFAQAVAGPSAGRTMPRQTPAGARRGSHAGAPPGRPGSPPATTGSSRGQATARPGRGVATRAHGSPSHANGTPTRAHGSPSHANPTRSTAHGAPTRAHGSPPRAHPAPTRAHGSPAQAGGNPARPDRTLGAPETIGP
jgi:RNA polymerase sigma factor (sigma-70 family)